MRSLIKRPAWLSLALAAALAACDSGGDAALKLTDDQAVAENGQALTLSVLDNDRGRKLKLLSAEGAQHGRLSVVSDRLRYEPDALYAGQDRFSYRVRDASGAEASATVTMQLRQSLQLQGLVQEAGKSIAGRRVIALLDERHIGEAVSDGAGAFRISLSFSDASQTAGLLHLQTGVDVQHPRSQLASLLASPRTLLLRAGSGHSLDARSLSALQLDEFSSASAARQLFRARALSEGKTWPTEESLRQTLPARTVEDQAATLAAARIFQEQWLPAAGGPATLWDLLNDDVAMRQLRDQARTRMPARYQGLIDEMNVRLRSGVSLSEDRLPVRYVIATLQAYVQAPAHEDQRLGWELQLQPQGKGSLHAQQSFAPDHSAIRWQLGADGRLRLDGSGTETAAGTSGDGQPFREQLMDLRVLERSAFGDLMLLRFCTETEGCSHDRPSGWFEVPALGLHGATDSGFRASEMPGTWFLPIGPLSYADVHIGAGRLSERPIKLLPDGHVSATDARWTLEDGALVIQNTQQERWQLRRLHGPAGQQHLVQLSYRGPAGEGSGLGRAYRLSEMPAWTAQDLVGGWSAAQIGRNFRLKADGGVSLTTTQEYWEGRWQLEPEGRVVFELHSGEGFQRLAWTRVATEAGATLLVEQSLDEDAPGGRALRYSHKP